MLFAGCPICQCNTDLDIVSGSVPVVAGSELVLSLDSEGFTAGPTDCGGHWYVDKIEGGNSVIGTITNCGTFTAPTTPPDHDVLIEATEYEMNACADCCPYGQKSVKIVARP